MIRLVISDTISFAHTLPTFPEGHKCHNIHGHNARIEVAISGRIGTDGTLIDHALVKECWRRYDHSGLLNDHPDFSGKGFTLVPSIENIVLILQALINEVLLSRENPMRLDYIKWWETDNVLCEWRPDDYE